MKNNNRNTTKRFKVLTDFVGNMYGRFLWENHLFASSFVTLFKKIKWGLKFLLLKNIIISKGQRQSLVTNLYICS